MIKPKIINAPGGIVIKPFFKNSGSITITALTEFDTQIKKGIGLEKNIEYILRNK